jgi:hypothetical protein
MLSFLLKLKLSQMSSYQQKKKKNGYILIHTKKHCFFRGGMKFYNIYETWTIGTSRPLPPSRVLPVRN